jgi:hypothetical protein
MHHAEQREPINNPYFLTPGLLPTLSTWGTAMQSNPVSALRVKEDALREEVRLDGRSRQLFLRYQAVFLAQVSQGWPATACMRVASPCRPQAGLRA